MHSVQCRQYAIRLSVECVVECVVGGWLERAGKKERQAPMVDVECRVVVCRVVGWLVGMCWLGYRTAPEGEPQAHGSSSSNIVLLERGCSAVEAKPYSINSTTTDMCRVG